MSLRNYFLYPYNQINRYSNYIFDKFVSDSFELKKLILAMVLTYLPYVVLMCLSFGLFVMWMLYMIYCDYLTKEKK